MGLDHALQATAPALRLQSGKPFLGICLGLQLLFDGTTESGGVEGLGLVPGQVTEFDRSLGLPVPHIGWNDLQQRWACVRLDGGSAPCC